MTLHEAMQRTRVELDIVVGRIIDAQFEKLLTSGVNLEDVEEIQNEQRKEIAICSDRFLAELPAKLLEAFPDMAPRP